MIQSITDLKAQIKSVDDMIIDYEKRLYKIDEELTDLENERDGIDFKIESLTTKKKELRNYINAVLIDSGNISELSKVMLRTFPIVSNDDARKMFTVYCLTENSIIGCNGHLAFEVKIDVPQELQNKYLHYQAALEPENEFIKFIRDPKDVEDKELNINKFGERFSKFLNDSEHCAIVENLSEHITELYNDAVGFKIEDKLVSFDSSYIQVVKSLFPGKTQVRYKKDDYTVVIFQSDVATVFLMPLRTSTYNFENVLRGNKTVN